MSIADDDEAIVPPAQKPTQTGVARIVA